jgi:hydrogenase maturation protein HypF
MWEALLNDLRRGVALPVIAARFHQGLVRAVTATAEDLCRLHMLDTVVLGGGVFQNRLLLDGVSESLRSAGLEVLSPVALPANDGGLSLGQAAVAAARLICNEPEIADRSTQK